MTHIDTDTQKIDEILSRGVEEVVGKDDLRRELLSGKRLRIKFGVDPTSRIFIWAEWRPY